MAIETTSLDYKKPDGLTELAKRGAEMIAHNAQKNQEHLSGLFARMGRAEANINAGMGGGPGLTEDPLNPGLYFMADDSPLFEDPDAPGFYTF